MALYSIREINSDISLGIWEIEETEDTLNSYIELSEQEKQNFNAFKSKARRIQWLATRVLLKTMTNSIYKIDYSSTGKPFLKNSPIKISLSHSDKYVAILLNKKEETGIDIERIGDKIERIKHKFLNSKELSNIQEQASLQKLHIYWAAKESLYKLYGKKELIFKENLLIDSFEYAEKGNLKASINQSGFNKSFLLEYEKINGHILVFVKCEL